MPANRGVNAALCESCRTVTALVRIDGGGDAGDPPVALCGRCYTRLLRIIDTLDSADPRPIRIEPQLRTRRRDPTPT